MLPEAEATALTLYLSGAADLGRRSVIAHAQEDPTSPERRVLGRECPLGVSRCEGQ